MWKNEQSFRLILNKKASEEIIWHYKHYLGRGFFFLGVIKHFKSGCEFYESVGIDLQVLINTHKEHYQISQKTFADPKGGPYPGYPKGASWDKISETTNCTISGKRTGSAVADEVFYVVIVTNTIIIHYCMCGTDCPRKVKKQGTCTGTPQTGGIVFFLYLINLYFYLFVIKLYFYLCLIRL